MASFNPATIERLWRETLFSLVTEQKAKEPEKLIGKVTLSMPFDFSKFVDCCQIEIMESDNQDEMQQIVFNYFMSAMGWHKDQAIAAYPNPNDFIEIHFNSDQDAMLWKLANGGAA